MNPIGYVYITTNAVNNKKYIGKRTKPYFDVKYYGSGKHLRNAIKKYGIENFSCRIIEWCVSICELNTREKYWIAHYNAQQSNEYYNISEGGDWGDISRGMSPQERKDWGERISKANTGSKRTPEQRKFMSKQMSGVPHTVTEKLIHSNQGKNNPRYGSRWSIEDKIKLSQVSTTKKPVEMKLKGITIDFESVNQCAKYLKLNYNISKFIVKKIIKEKKPYQLAGHCKNQEALLLITGLEIKFKETVK